MPPLGLAALCASMWRTLRSRMISRRYDSSHGKFAGSGPQYSARFPNRSTKSTNCLLCGFALASRALAALRTAGETSRSQSYTRPASGPAAAASSSAGGDGSPAPSLGTRNGAAPAAPAPASASLSARGASSEPLADRSAARAMASSEEAARRPRAPPPACAENSSLVRSAKRVTPSFIPPPVRSRSALCASMRATFSRKIFSRCSDSSHGGGASGQYVPALSNLTMNSANASECVAGAPAVDALAALARTLGTFTVGTSLTTPARGRDAESPTSARAARGRDARSEAKSAARETTHVANDRRRIARVPARAREARPAPIAERARADAERERTIAIVDDRGRTGNDRAAPSPRNSARRTAPRRAAPSKKGCWTNLNTTCHLTLYTVLE